MYRTLQTRHADAESVILTRKSIPAETIPGHPPSLFSENEAIFQFYFTLGIFEKPETLLIFHESLYHHNLFIYLISQKAK